MLKAEVYGSNISERQKVPYLVSAGHNKYASCLPQYLEEMKSLSVTAPEIEDESLKGKFCVRRASGRCNGVWTDMGLEQTYNCDAKTAISWNKTKTRDNEKYLKVVPKFTTISEKMKKLVHLEVIHKDYEDCLTVSNWDNDTAERIKTVVKEETINPFQCENNVDLLDISSGKKSCIY